MVYSSKTKTTIKIIPYIIRILSISNKIRSFFRWNREDIFGVFFSLNGKNNITSGWLTIFLCTRYQVCTLCENSVIFFAKIFLSKNVQPIFAATFWCPKCYILQSPLGSSQYIQGTSYSTCIWWTSLFPINGIS